jgi:hypothetical protein
MRTGLRTLAAAAATTTLMVVTSVCTAHAAVKVSSCTVTAVAPTLSGSTLYGSATINCTSASSITGTISIVELDYATGTKTITATSPQDATMPKNAVALNAVPVAAKATITVCIPGGLLVAPATKCGASTLSLGTNCTSATPTGYNTEVGTGTAGYEEYDTKIVLSIPAAGTDRTLPKDNSYAC